MTVAIQISPNASLFVKDPQTSGTGRNMLKHAIPLMQELGFEKFTFRKLAIRMGASEITIYRYFENKHKLLLYLLSWYWEWVKYSIIYNTRNLEDPEQKLKLAIHTVIDSSKRNPLVEYIDEAKLYELVVEESEKAYHTKQVDEANKNGLFLTLKSLKSEISHILLAINPAYPFPNSLASTILKMSASLRFFAHHLPSMSDVRDVSTMDDSLASYLESLTLAALKK